MWTQDPSTETFASCSLAVSYLATMRTTPMSANPAPLPGHHESGQGYPWVLEQQEMKTYRQHHYDVYNSGAVGTPRNSFLNAYPGAPEFWGHYTTCLLVIIIANCSLVKNKYTLAVVDPCAEKELRTRFDRTLSQIFDFLPNTLDEASIRSTISIYMFTLTADGGTANTPEGGQQVHAGKMTFLSWRRATWKRATPKARAEDFPHGE